MSIEVVVRLPEVVVKRIKALGIDVESRIIDAIIQELNLDPEEEAEVYAELATRFLEDGKKLIDKDPVQASEKLYKAAEECVKALTMHFKLKEVVERVRSKGRWSVMELEKAVEAISDRVGSWLYDAWDHAWALHVWRFHEAKLDSEALKRRLPYIERMVNETNKMIRGSK